MENPVIARLIAERTNNTERVEVCVREIFGTPQFRVFVSGGVLSNGETEEHFDDLREAVVYATTEILLILTGED